MIKNIKKFILLFLAFAWIFSFSWYIWNAQCEFKDWEEFSLVDNLAWCKPKYLAWEDWVEYSIEWGFKEKVWDIITLVMTLLWVSTVWALAFWGFLMVISWWEEGKLDKAKEVIKWWIFWFLWMISAWWIIAIVVNTIYFLID